MRTAAVILNYNDAQGTVDAVKRINGFFCFDSIVVVDNASTDNSAELIRSAVEKLDSEEAAGSCTQDGTDCGCSMSTNAAAPESQTADDGNQRKRIHFVVSGRNGGYGSGNNLGVRYAAEHCAAELAVIANPDAEFDEELISSMRQLFEARPDTAVVGAVMAEADTGESGIKTAESCSYDEYAASGWKRRGTAGCVVNGCPILRRVFKRMINYPPEHYFGSSESKYRDHDDRRYISIGSKASKSLHAGCGADSVGCTAHGGSVNGAASRNDAAEVYAVHGSLLMVSVRKFIEAGGYDEHMFLYCEENTLAEKMYRRGYKSFLLKRSYKHAGSVSITGSGLKAAARQRIRNASERYYYEHYLGCGKAAMHAVRLIQLAVMAETYIAGFLHLI